jgi:hypothetical protein
MSDMGVLPTGGYAGAPTGGDSIMPNTIGKSSECHFWAVVLLIAAGDEENETRNDDGGAQNRA